MKKSLILFSTLAFLAACSPEQNKIQNASAPVATQNTQATSFNGTDVRKDDIGGDFTLLDGQKQLFSISSLKGKIVILTFGYTHCPDVCPATLQTYYDVLQQLGDEAKQVAVVFVSVDPNRDTPELISAYAKQFHPEFIGLTAANEQEIALVKQQYRVVSAKTKEQAENLYLVDHTAGAYLLDKNGATAVFEPYGKTASEITADIRLLLKSS
ncbi:MAG: SCO family protein [Neisseria sp.]|nr:SCO family protein [Neisseria sp.]